MNEQPDDQGSGDGVRRGSRSAAENARAERLKAALKANMARRKSQARARGDAATGDDGQGEG